LEVAIVIMTSHLDDENIEVREAALEALSRVAPKGHPPLIETLIKSTQCKDKGIRQFALKGLAKLGRAGGNVIKGLGNVLKQVNSMLAPMLLMDLKTAAEHGKEKLLADLMTRLKHESVELRLNAITTLVRISDQKDPLFIQAICTGLLDSDAGVQEAASSAMDKSISKGHPFAVLALFGLLDIQNKLLLRRVVEVLPRVAGTCEQSQQLLSSLLQEQSGHVRSAIFHVLATTVDKNYLYCASVCSCWRPNINPSASTTATSEDCEECPVGVSIACQALSCCLLQRHVHFADAVLTALRRAGSSGDAAATLLRECMSLKRWFVEWQTIEDVCSAAAAGTLAATHMATLSAKREHEPPVDSSFSTHASLHHPECPCASVEPHCKKARFGGA